MWGCPAIISAISHVASRGIITAIPAEVQFGPFTGGEAAARVRQKACVQSHCREAEMGTLPVEQDTNLPSPVPTTQPLLSLNNWWQLRGRWGLPRAPSPPAAQRVTQGHPSALAAQPSLTWGLLLMGDQDLGEAWQEGRSGSIPFHLMLCKAGPAACRGVILSKSLSLSGPL